MYELNSDFILSSSLPCNSSKMGWRLVAVVRMDALAVFVMTAMAAFAIALPVKMVDLVRYKP